MHFSSLFFHCLCYLEDVLLLGLFFAIVGKNGRPFHELFVAACHFVCPINVCHVPLKILRHVSSILEDLLRVECCLQRLHVQGVHCVCHSFPLVCKSPVCIGSL